MDLKLIFLAGFLLIILSFCAQPKFDYIFKGLVEIPHPSKSAGQSSLADDKEGIVYSAWIEYFNDSLCELQYAELDSGRWSQARPIACGDNWFVNWADFPALAVNGDQLAAHWLQYAGDGAYDYDVMIAQSSDGMNWSEPWIPHTDGVAAEHGFVSLLPLPGHRFLATWLDGRNTKGDEKTSAEHSHDHGHGGAMTLRTACFDQDGTLSDEFELDPKVCDCCQTSATLSVNGPLIAYRNRSDDEIRDIYVVRQVAGEWQTPIPVHNDGWQIGGCPVNGPAITAMGNRVAVAWYTKASDLARVKLAFSPDDGASFTRPLIISEMNPLGRVDLVFLEGEQLLVSWVEQISDDVAQVMGRVVNPALEMSEPFKIVETSTARKSGFPRLVTSGEKVYLSWTKLEGVKTRVNTAELVFVSGA